MLCHKLTSEVLGVHLCSLSLHIVKHSESLLSFNMLRCEAIYSVLGFGDLIPISNMFFFFSVCSFVTFPVSLVIVPASGLVSWWLLVSVRFSGVRWLNFSIKWLTGLMSLLTFMKK